MGKPNLKLQVDITPRQKDLIARAAKKRRQSMSAFVRDAVEALLATNGFKPANEVPHTGHVATESQPIDLPTPIEEPSQQGQAFSIAPVYQPPSEPAEHNQRPIPDPNPPQSPSACPSCRQQVWGSLCFKCLSHVQP